MPYERAQRLLTLADALSLAGDDDRAQTFRHRGLELAWTHRFTELLMRPEVPARAPAAPRGSSPKGAPAAERRGLEDGGRRVVRAMSALRVGALVDPDGAAALVRT